MSADQEQILQSVSAIISLSAEEKEYFLSTLQQKSIKRKEFLLREGEICKSETYVAKGCLRIYTVDQNGNDHVLMFGIEDYWISDLYSFLAQKPASMNIDALEDSELFQISKASLENLYRQVPQFERFFRIKLQNAFVAHWHRINQNLSNTAEERYLDFLEKYPNLEQRLPQKQISAYLGITPVFLSMLRRKMAKS